MKMEDLNETSTSPSVCKFSHFFFVFNMVNTAFGIFGNILAICVIQLKLKHNASNLFLTLLAAQYLLMLLISVLYSVTNHIDPTDQSYSVEAVQFCLGIAWKVLIFLTLWMVVLIAVSKTVILSKPHLVARIIQIKNVMCSVIIGCTVAVLLYLPHMTLSEEEYEKSALVHNKSQIALCCTFKPTESDILVYNFIVSFCLGKTIPCTILTVCLVFMAHFIYKKRPKRKSDLVLAELLEGIYVVIGISIMIMVSSVFDIVYSIGKFNHELHDYPELVCDDSSGYEVLYHLRYTAVNLNSTFNVLLYFLLRKEFRLNLKQVLSCK